MSGDSWEPRAELRLEMEEIMPRDYYEEDFEPESRGRRRSVRSSYEDEVEQRAIEGRRRGGERSSHLQARDEYGQFVGYEGEREERRRPQYDDEPRSYRGRSREEEDIVDSAGRHFTRESYERAQEGRSRGGQVSGIQRRRSEFEEERPLRSSRSRYRDEEEDRGDIVDSAGRHFTRESYERAQEGRSRGGRH